MAHPADLLFGITRFEEMATVADRTGGELFGHPKGLYVLFFTELWERFSFYGMKTLLILYMINHFFWSQEDASSLLGTYAGLAYGVPVIGGFIADRFLGPRKAVILGAILLSAGHITMAFEPLPFFYTALGLIIAGVGLLKPNVSTQVGALYAPGDPRRDGAFTIFYMGINVGALAGPLICDWLRVNYGYHYGFGAAGVGMILGLIVYVIGQRKLVEFNQEAVEVEDEVPAVGAHPPHVVRDRVLVLLIVFAFVILFWTAFEQNANVMVVWADKHTNLQLASLEPQPVELDDGAGAGAEGKGMSWSEWLADWWDNPRMSSGQTQSFNPFFIIALSPLFAFMWMWLDRRRKQPSTPTKMVMGLALVVAAYLAMYGGARSEDRESSVRLERMPEGVDVSQYGLTRLSYDAEAGILQLHGVLPDLDRIRLLAESAPAAFREKIEALVEESKAAEEAAGGGDETQKLTRRMDSAPAGYRVVGVEAPKIASWDSGSKTLTVTDEINERARMELLAAAARPEFKKAVDELYEVSSGLRVTVWWLILFNLFLTMGELCISPVGLSLVTKLAPARHVGLMMGGWFLATAIAEKLAQVFGGMWGKMPPAQYFVMFMMICGAGSLLMALLIPMLKRMMHGVK